MFEKLFKICLLIILILFLGVFYSSTQNGRYEPVTQYEGSMGIFDTRQGVVYMLDFETNQWSVIRPMISSGPTI